jgi:hypothetical protein
MFYRKRCFRARLVFVFRGTKIAFTDVISKLMNVYCLCSKCMVLFVFQMYGIVH